MSRSRNSRRGRKWSRAAQSCRNHGGCKWCEGNRLHRHSRSVPAPDPDDDFDAVMWAERELAAYQAEGMAP